MEGARDYTHILSVQPFWKAEKVNQQILLNPDTGSPLAVIYELLAEKDAKSLHSLPGIGLLGLMFSLDQNDSPAMLCGLLNQTKDVPLFGSTHTLLCQFFPGQFTGTFGIPCQEVTDIEAPLEDFIHIGTISDEIASADSFQQRIEIFSKFVTKWRNRTRSHASNELVTCLMKDAIKKHDILKISQLEKETGYSSRYLQRIVLESVGLAPKAALNNIRFQNALRMILETPTIPLATVAQQCGYYDQSHFTKIFHAYTGMTPSSFVKQLRKQFWQEKD